MRNEGSSQIRNFFENHSGTVSLAAVTLGWALSWLVLGPLVLNIELGRGISRFFIPLVTDRPQAPSYSEVLGAWYSLSYKTLLFTLASWGGAVALTRLSFRGKSKQHKGEVILYWLFIFVLLLFSLPRFLSAAGNLNTEYSFNYNEGVNAVHADRLLHGQALYQEIQPGNVMPVNYPPFSFWIVASLSRIGFSALVVGRVLSLISFVGIAILAFAIIRKLTGDVICGVVSACTWCALMSVLGSDYIGVNDPQMLGHFGSVLSMYLYVRWRESLTFWKVIEIASIASASLFIKHTFVAAPLCIACALLAAKKNQEFRIYAVSGLFICSATLAIVWFSAGHSFYEDFFGNLAALNGASSNLQLLIRTKDFLLANLMLLFLVPIIIARFRCPMILFYGIFASFGVLYILRGRYGVGVNVWFEVILFLCLTLGLALAEIKFRTVLAVTMASAVIPVLLHANAPLLACGTPSMRSKISSYNNLVLQIRNSQGPILSDDLLLPYLANKPVHYEVFLTTRFIRTGKIPEESFVEPIRHRNYALIITSVRLNRSQITTERASISQLSERWTDRSLNAILDNYSLESVSSQPYVYRPR